LSQAFELLFFFSIPRLHLLGFFLQVTEMPRQGLIIDNNLEDSVYSRCPIESLR
jgi:hypothetical protein